MRADVLTNSTVRVAIEALQTGDKETWSSLFTPDATMTDDGHPRDLKAFTKDAFGHERYRGWILVLQRWHASRASLRARERIRRGAQSLVGTFPLSRKRKEETRHRDVGLQAVMLRGFRLSRALQPPTLGC